MMKKRRGWEGKCRWMMLPASIIFLLAMSLSSALAFQLNVVGANKNGTTTPVANYRWLVEEDATFNVVPNDPATNFAMEFHKSYMPVVTKGHSGDPLPDLDPAKRYFVSVLPDSGYSNGGAQLTGNGSVTVYVNQYKIPTAQISIFVFEDNFPVNNAPDLPEEQGLAGFRIMLEEPGGKYGMAGGQVSLDVFGNPLGTTYMKDVNGDYVLDVNGLPMMDMMGDMNIFTDENGRAVIKNLAPGKYGVVIVPPNAVETPSGSGNWVSTQWQQTTTIEGTPVTDAWVKANEPPYFQEFGPASWHVFVGFVRPTVDTTVLTGGSTIEGNVANLHLSRPPEYTFNAGASVEHTTPWVGLNDLSQGTIGRCVYAQPTAGSAFSIPNVPPGNYQLVIWDSNLDLVIAFYGITVNPDGGCNTMAGCNLGDVPAFQWFTRLEHWVFNDVNENGTWDTGETGIPEQAVNVRWRDGTLYNSMPTDSTGFVPFDEVFPFFAWQIAEVDFARFKATGVTVTVDGGGPIPFNDPWSFGGILNPQIQDPADPFNEYGTGKYRTETGPVLTQGFQGFLGQTSVMQWGKTAYGPGENGGISGIVYYAVTRAEDNPQQAAAEPWEPGIPRVQVNLYRDADDDGIVDDINLPAGIQYADVDNYPFDWSGGGAQGTEDVERSGVAGFDLGDAIEITTSDSWDDNLPTGCPGADPSDPVIPLTKCYDGMRNWNQVRPGIFDGGYAFAGYDPVKSPAGLQKGSYIVEAMPPPGYEILKEEDRNVDFGDEYTPSPLLLPPVCVGDPHLVPAEFSLFPLFDENGAPVAPYKAGQTTSLSNRKKVCLSGGMNAAADFFMFTEVPIAAHVMGFILDDAGNEFDRTSPQFGEKFAPPWLPVSFHDWTGRQIAKTYSDQYGAYNALLPSTFTANIGMPSGMSPNMLTACMNTPGSPDPDTGVFIPDPNYNPQYSTFCYTFQYMPGSTTYLDTPVLPIAAFAGPDQYPLDSEFPDGTPRIYSASSPTNGNGGGPYVAAVDEQIVITSMGMVSVPNPEYNGANAKTIQRDYGFGDTMGTVAINGNALTNVLWNANEISATVPAGTTTGQLEIVRGDNGLAAITGLTVQVGNSGIGAVRTVSAGQSIQAAIDAAGPRDLILVGPGVYDEMVIMWKPVRLQGWGEGASVIRAFRIPSEKLTAWRNTVEALIANGDVSLLPGQEVAAAGTEPGFPLATEEGAGILVLPNASGTNAFNVMENRMARIDGFTVTGADTGGGITVNGYAHYLRIGNNRIMSNSGFFSGGIRIGHPELTAEVDGQTVYQDADNDDILIHHNHVLNNGGLNGAGGGISLYTGAFNYEVSRNYVAGNFSGGNGAGIGHLGYSRSGEIIYNTIIFNESFNQGVTVSGGGIYIAGQAPIAPPTLGPGSGDINVFNNLIQGNYAGAGDGGGICLNEAGILTINIYNNMIVNNVAALAGGGILLHDASNVSIMNNTIANNDSTATASGAFTPGQHSQSNPQPAGIVSRAHSDGLIAALPVGSPVYSNPVLRNNIIWHNRSLYFQIVAGNPPLYLLTDGGFDDLAVLGTPVARQLDPRFCILTSTAGYNISNMVGDPNFILGGLNGNRGQTVLPGETTTTIQPAVAFDEGGNFIKVRFGPLTRFADATPGDGMPGDVSDYHILGASPAIDAGSSSSSPPSFDFDQQARPNGPAWDIGADEYYTP